MNTVLKKLREARTALRRPVGNRQMPIALPGAIASRLTALAQRVLHVSWAGGALWIVTAVCSLVLVQGTLDWLFDLSHGVRLLFLLVDFLIVGAIVLWFGFWPWRRRLTPEEAALRAERRWPELRTGLISAVQLARRPGGSPVLVNAMLARMAGRIAAFDLRQVVAWKSLAKLAIAAAVLAMVTAGLAVLLAPRSVVLLQRMVLWNVPLPTETIVRAITEDFTIANGQNIVLSAKAEGVIPRSGRVEVVYEGRRPEMITVMPKGASPEVFSLPLANVQQPLTYRFYLNDGRGEEHKVELIHPPVMEEVQFDVEPPAYTGLPPTRLQPGSLSLMAGSKLKISGKGSQPLKGVRLVLTGGAERSVDAKVSGSEFSAAVDIPKDGLNGLWFELKNDRDTLSQNNAIYAMEILSDRKPEIIFEENQVDKANVVVEQKPKLRFEVRDDFKVQEVYLCVQSLNSLGEGEQPDPEKAKAIPIPVPQPAARIAFDYEWSDPGKAVDWAEGQSYICWIKAVDNNSVTGPGVTYSTPHQWSVVSRQTKREELAEQLRKHAESIKDLSGAQESLRKELGEILKHSDKK